MTYFAGPLIFNKPTKRTSVSMDVDIENQIIESTITAGGVGSMTY